jgi:hypothetical protein
MGRKAKDESGMLPEYDFKGAVKGKYADRLEAGSNVVVIAPELVALFPDSETVNETLRAVADMVRRTGGKRAA